MPQPTLELADIFRQHAPAYRQAHDCPLHPWRRMRAIENCRTAALGGAVEWCDHCEHTRIVYRSCRDRHGPKCQGLGCAHWLQQRPDATQCNTMQPDRPFPLGGLGGTLASWREIGLATRATREIGDILCSPARSRPLRRVTKLSPSVPIWAKLSRISAGAPGAARRK
jgi:hypothetical protein